MTRFQSHNLGSRPGGLRMGVNEVTENPTASLVSCLDAMNPYRRAAGFSPFEDQNILPVNAKVVAASGDPSPSTSSPFLSSGCKSMQTPHSALPETTASSPSTKNAKDAVHVQTGELADCSAAVDPWKGDLVNFRTLPPVYNNDSKPYQDLQNMSFVALSNPKARANVDCSYITCLERTASIQTPENTREFESDENAEKRDLEEAE
ncbi:hypothetical protein Efla_004735 [Eimeria flavescens]